MIAAEGRPRSTKEAPSAFRLDRARTGETAPHEPTEARLRVGQAVAPDVRVVADAAKPVTAVLDVICMRAEFAGVQTLVRAGDRRGDESRVAARRRGSGRLRRSSSRGRTSYRHGRRTSSGSRRRWSWGGRRRRGRGGRRTTIEPLRNAAVALRAHDPERTLERGYALAETAEGEPLTGAAAVAAAERFSLRFADGRVDARTDGDPEPGPGGDHRD